jgi:anti-anti-sigma factor
MAIEQWSETVVLGELADDPQFSDDLQAILEQLAANPAQDVVLNFASVNFLNSSNLAKLLKLRKQVTSNARRMKLCGINRHVWGVFLVTGLDRLFDVADNVTHGLASLQLES